MLINIKKLNNNYKKILTRKYSINKPFSFEIINFLDHLSAEILNSKKIIFSQDIIAFGFWCRKKNIERISKDYVDSSSLIGIGKIFHISPSNTPINFAYSMTFGLLAGNSNIIRVSPKHYKKFNKLYEVILNLLKLKKFNKITNLITLITYEYDDFDEITKYISSIADARIIWGGDKTIQNIKSYSTPAHSFDIPFRDRYSFSVINTNYLKKLSKNEFKKLVKNFYNDTYYVDQNACSSPHLIVWIGNKKNLKDIDLFWKFLSEQVQEKYYLEETAVVDKYNQLLKNIIDLEGFGSYKIYSNKIFTVQLSMLSSNISSYRGRWGFFYEYSDKNLDFIKKIVNKKFQTMTYAGLEKNELYEYFQKNKFIGIDRVVPIGRSLDIGVIWDGYDMIRTLSRRIVIS